VSTGFVQGHFASDIFYSLRAALVLNQLQSAPGGFNRLIKALITGISRGERS
jgi:hypothetical protein